MTEPIRHTLPTTAPNPADTGLFAEASVDDQRRLQALAEVFVTRRTELGYTQAELASAGGVSLATVQGIENARGGASLRARTTAGLERGLAWRPGSIRRLLQGADPEPITLQRTPTADDAGSLLFASPAPSTITDPTSGQKYQLRKRQLSRKPYPRWRDEDMPLRPGDVIAVGLTHNRAVIGEVAGVNDHAFRLNQYNRTADVFNTGTTVIGWQQVEEFGPVARRRGAAWMMQELLRWAENWQVHD
ncbi:helix-turn-helix transcriptional regulator [Micromonospora sp. NPDC049081]|uniref:helix-turn-helix transcriptional regulator n=1 Tax=Micromonospora sp. NPDC049081 TaxID=3155150 RepID=UPI0033FC952D